jgi:hypothetical protein
MVIGVQLQLSRVYGDWCSVATVTNIWRLPFRCPFLEGPWHANDGFNGKSIGRSGCHDYMGIQKYIHIRSHVSHRSLISSSRLYFTMVRPGDIQETGKSLDIGAQVAKIIRAGFRGYTNKLSRFVAKSG